MNKWKQASIHLILWLGYILLYATLWRDSDLTFLHGLIREVSLLPVKIILVYITIYYLVPHYLQHKRHFEFVILFVILIALGGLLHTFYLHYILPLRISGLSTTELLFDLERITKRMTYLNSPMLFALTIVVIHNWYEQRERNTKIIQENLAARLQLLRNQIQPHFFFNTLNNLYSMALQKSEYTPTAILKLADLMRYLTEKNEKDWVSINDEIDFIQNYVALEELRYQDKVTMHWNISMNETREILIPPLLLTTFIENAFKHGVSENSQSASISIDIRTTNNLLGYCVTNTLPPSHERNPTNSVGTGLTNLKSRLEILYHSNFKLITLDNRTSFSAELQIPLNYESV